MTNARDIALAVDAGADAVGVIVSPHSPRAVTCDAARALAFAIPPYVSGFGVVTSPSSQDAEALRASGYALQFSGDETARDCQRLAAGQPYVKAFHIRVDAPPRENALEALAEYDGALWMFDTAVDGKHGGTGVAFAWERVATVARERPIVVSGGLTPANVGACVRAVRPYAVDVRSGVETAGAKDPAKMRAFIEAVREADRA